MKSKSKQGGWAGQQSASTTWGLPHSLASSYQTDMTKLSREMHQEVASGNELRSPSTNTLRLIILHRIRTLTVCVISSSIQVVYVEFTNACRSAKPQSSGDYHVAEVRPKIPCGWLSWLLLAVWSSLQVELLTVPSVAVTEILVQAFQVRM